MSIPWGYLPGCLELRPIKLFLLRFRQTVGHIYFTSYPVEYLPIFYLIRPFDTKYIRLWHLHISKASILLLSGFPASQISRPYTRLYSDQRKFSEIIFWFSDSFLICIGTLDSEMLEIIKLYGLVEMWYFSTQFLDSIVLKMMKATPRIKLFVSFRFISFINYERCTSNIVIPYHCDMCIFGLWDMYE